MAHQSKTPAEWDDAMSDGCSGVLNLWWRETCVAHDKAYHYGGSVEDKLVADDRLYRDMRNTPGLGGWLARRGWALVRYTGVRNFTFNYPPGHPSRSEDRRRVEAFNWLG